MSDKKKTLTDEVIANCSCWKEEDREVLSSMSDEKLTSFIDAEKSAVENTQKLEKLEKKKEDEPAPVANEKKKQTADEWFNAAPVEIQSAVRNAARIESRERQQLIDQIVGNVEDEAIKTRLTERLNSKSLEELEDTLLLANAGKKETSVPLFNYAANGGGSATTSNNQHTEENLPIPAINWGEEVN